MQKVYFFIIIMSSWIRLFSYSFLFHSSVFSSCFEMLWEFSIWFSSCSLALSSFSFSWVWRVSFRENLFRSHSCFIRISFNLHFLSRLVWFSSSLTWIILSHSRSMGRFLLRFALTQWISPEHWTSLVYIDEFITCVDNLCSELSEFRIKNSQILLFNIS